MKGGYCLVLSLPSEMSLRVKGRTFALAPGTYAYCGSALNSLDARVERHVRNFNGERVRQYWHIDYLLPSAAGLTIVKTHARSNIECALVSLLSKKGLEPIPHFGSSDCRSGCKGHLLRSQGSMRATAGQAFSSLLELGLSPEVLELKTPRPL